MPLLKCLTICPQAILVFSFVKYEAAKYGSYRYPLWADVIGWCMALASVIPIFVVMIVSIYRAEGSTFKEVSYPHGRDYAI